MKRDVKKAREREAPRLQLPASPPRARRTEEYERRRGRRRAQSAEAPGFSFSLPSAGETDKYEEYTKRDVKKVREKSPEEEAAATAAKAEGGRCRCCEEGGCRRRLRKPRCGEGCEVRSMTRLKLSSARLPPRLRASRGVAARLPKPRRRPPRNLPPPRRRLRLSVPPPRRPRRRPPPRRRAKAEKEGPSRRDCRRREGGAAAERAASAKAEKAARRRRRRRRRRPLPRRNPRLSSWRVRLLSMLIATPTLVPQAPTTSTEEQDDCGGEGRRQEGDRDLRQVLREQGAQPGDISAYDQYVNATKGADGARTASRSVMSRAAAP